jgi:hypothetical protein
MATTLREAGDFPAHYPDQPARLKIGVDSPLMTRGALIALARRLDKHLVEFNAGDLPVSIAPEAVPAAGQSAEETIARIGECRSWMTLRNVEHDPAYRALAAEAVDTVAPVVTAKTGAILQREAFIFISSPAAVTPFHFDEEHNILVQIEGEKIVTVFSQHDRELASQIDLERFHAGGHRNLKFEPAFESRGTPFRLAPGDALYIPPLAPHFVRVISDGPSLSLSCTWRSKRTKRAVYLHQINHELRRHGASPSFPGENPLADQLKIWRESAARRLKALTQGGAR